MSSTIAMLQVSNGRKTGFLGQNKIYIGRANKTYNLAQSPLANPYIISESTLNRTKVIELYREWLWCQVKSWQETGNLNPAVEALLDICDRVKGEHIILTCWCDPLACHGDIVVRCVNWMIAQGY